MVAQVAQVVYSAGSWERWKECYYSPYQGTGPSTERIVRAIVKTCYNI